MEALKDWWQQASPRDQLALVVCSVFLGIYILYVGVYKPVEAMRIKQIARNEAQLASLERVRSLAEQWKNRNKSSTDTTQTSIEEIVQRGLSANKLRVSGMDSSGNNGVRIRFEQVIFSDFLAWLYDMEISQGLRVQDLSVASGSDPGTVSANLRLFQD